MSFRTVLGALAVTAMAGSAPLLAAGLDVVWAEKRVYEILVDHAVVGRSSLAIARYTDGTEVATTDAKLTVSWTVFKYVYEYHGQEHWFSRQFHQLNSRTIDGGKRLTLSATRTEEGWRITKAGGQPARVDDVQLTTNYWRQPLPFAAGGRFSVLDADNGKIYDVRCAHIAQEEIAVGNTRVPCNHFQLKGGAEVELWFDPTGYLVRQVGTEEGHPIELRLVSVPQPATALARTAE